MSGRARAMKAIGNVLLGLALGLLSYYGLTTLVSQQAQSELTQSTESIPLFSTESPGDLVISAGGETPWDLEGWEEEDKAYWTALEDGGVFGRLVIPAMDLDTLVVKGVETADLRKGPGWIDWSDLPGPTGTCGISGHRTTYGAPFRRLGEVQVGDTIELYSPYRCYRYEVTEILVVLPSQIEVVASTEEPSLTLTACHPPYSARYRLAVRAKLVSVSEVQDSVN